MTFTTEDTQTAAPTTGATDPMATGAADPATGTAGGTDSGLDGVGGPEVRAQLRPMSERIFAVQQIYALRNRRFELQPTVGVSLNDPYVSHTGIGLAANYWITNVLAVGANFMFNQPFNGRSDVDLRSSRSIGLVVPINEYQLLAQANFTYVPLYGKFLMFNRFIFHYDFYLTAGLGVTRTRPIPVVDPEVRRFDWNTAILFNAGIGVRVFINRWFGIVAEVRNYIYPERLESLSIGTPNVRDLPPQNAMEMCRGMAGDAGGGPLCGSRYDPATWLGQTSLTDNVMIQVGFTMFLPFGVSYRLQK
ncbi:MAG: outer membrane beta-barrel domain-containing protein [Deltaproteobacteria bacterium]|nr:outer membrane beta-barrel domain-containing protein [Deltaproteobacteria bacterium]